MDLQNQQKYYIEEYKKEIVKMKNNINSKQLIDSRDIIFEDSLENIMTKLSSSFNSKNIKYENNDSLKEYIEAENDVNISSNSNIYNCNKKYNKFRNIEDLNMNFNYSIKLGINN